ncbi:hypothetical protein E6W39_01390 [Kitasatospora acidiphila]|uniref:Uncharacterized protein n=1 Tax=Kitasatospora acidiphila TaxID=2567942 RepID=A0A540VWJ3_9ACTN|nr:hypothetical protein [Kitasatospora acidiphila]TQF01136.1 hypothetical protein E6W39_01390 [Kitasatospora acidiphila]
MNDRSTSQATVGATVHLIQPDGSAGPALAPGFLNGASTVLVPDPPQAVSDPWSRYQVQIAPDADPGDAVEALRVAGVSLAALDLDTGRTAAAILALGSPSRQTQAAPAITLGALTESVRSHPADLWAAYAELGYPITRPASEPAAESAWWLHHATGDVGRFCALICCPTHNCGPCR